MAEVLSSSPALESGKSPLQQIENLLMKQIGDDLTLQDTDQMEEINKLDALQKEQLLQTIRQFSESVFEIKENLPLNINKLQKILEIYEVKKHAQAKDIKAEVVQTKTEVAQTKLIEVMNTDTAKLNILQDVSLIASVSENKNQEVDIKEKEVNKEKLLYEQTQKILESVDLTKHPNYQKWLVETKQVLLQAQPDLAQKPEELLMKSQALILEQHKAELILQKPELKSDFQELSRMIYQDTALVGALRALGASQSIPKMVEVESALKKDPSVLKREIEYAQASILPDAGKVAQIAEGKVILGEAGTENKQTLIDTTSQKTFLLKNGYKAESSQNYPIDMKVRSEMESVQKTLQKQKTEFDAQSKIIDTANTRQKLSPESVTSLLSQPGLTPSLQSQLSELQEGYQELKNKEQKAKNDPLESLLIEGAKENVQKLEAKVQQELQKLVDQSQALTQSMQENQTKLKELQNGQKDMVNTYQGNLKMSEIHLEQTLDFLHHIGLTNIPQDDFNKIMTRVNIAPQKYGFSKPFQLETFFQVKAGEDAQKPYKEFIQFFNKLTGLTPNEQINDQLIPKLLNGSDKQYTSVDFSAKVRNALYEDGQVGGVFKLTALDKNFGNEK